MLEKKVHSFIENQNLFTSNSTIVIGVSGGIDSMSLLYFFTDSFKHTHKIVVAHVNHMLRGNESVADFNFVRKKCHELDIEFFGTNINIPAKKKLEKTNGQTVARNYRYKFYKEIMNKLNAQYLLLGHQLDDQAETVVMNLVRGGGALSFLGIPSTKPFATGLLVRPFLNITRDEIASYATSNKIPYREDSSNSDKNYTRNRIRSELIPQLKNENAQFLENISLRVEHDRETQIYLQKQAQKYYESMSKISYSSGFTLFISQLKACPQAILRRVIILALKHLYSSTALVYTLKHVNQLLDLIINKKNTTSLQLSGSCYAEISCNRLRFFKEREEFIRYELKVSKLGETALPNGDKLLVTPGPRQDLLSRFGVAHTLVPEAFPIVIRNKNDGDRVLLPDFINHKKVKKLFYEKQVPAYLRGSWPVIWQENNIVWIPYLYPNKAIHPDGEKLLYLYYCSHHLPRELAIVPNF